MDSCLDDDQNHNPNPSFSSRSPRFAENIQLDPISMEFDELLDYLMLDCKDDFSENSHVAAAGSGATSGNGNNVNININIRKYRDAAAAAMKKSKLNSKEVSAHRVAFRTQSQLENMDDGFRWRKYGKKPVKNNPNPRNYYKCSSTDCDVKKRIERDREDSSYVITTYEGVHNHDTPNCVQLYIKPAADEDPNNIWTSTLQ